MLLSVVAVMFMLILLAVFFFNIPAECGVKQTVGIILFLICVIYLGLSIYWLCTSPEYTFAKNDNDIKIRYLKYYIQYALDTGHYSKDELKTRLGNVWNVLYPNS